MSLLACTSLGHPMVTSSRPTGTNAPCLIMFCQTWHFTINKRDSCKSIDWPLWGNISHFLVYKFCPTSQSAKQSFDISSMTLGIGQDGPPFYALGFPTKTWILSTFVCIPFNVVCGHGQEVAWDQTWQLWFQRESLGQHIGIKVGMFNFQAASWP